MGWRQAGGAVSVPWAPGSPAPRGPPLHLQDEVLAAWPVDDAVRLLALLAALARDGHQPKALGDGQAQGCAGEQARGSPSSPHQRLSGGLTGLQVLGQGTWLQDTFLSCVALSVLLVQTQVSHLEE